MNSGTERRSDCQRMHRSSHHQRENGPVALPVGQIHREIGRLAQGVSNVANHTNHRDPHVGVRHKVVAPLPIGTAGRWGLLLATCAARSWPRPSRRAGHDPARRSAAREPAEFRWRGRNRARHSGSRRWDGRAPASRHPPPHKPRLLPTPLSGPRLLIPAATTPGSASIRSSSGRTKLPRASRSG